MFIFVKYNRIEGDYLEFGTYSGRTFVYAYNARQKASRSDIHLYAFDSFAGLPEPRGVDIHPDFRTGQFSKGRVEFEQVLQTAGIPKQDYTIIEGFFKASLTVEMQRQLPLKQAAIVYIDSDLYESAQQVLAFIEPYLVTGTLIAFDDFFCFNGDPDRGEQRAWREFREAHPELNFNEYFDFDWAGKVFICKRNE